jgi:microcystin-dependent protein
MPYNVNYTDRQNISPITVFDNTSNTDTSLTFPGRNVTGYGQTIAENFLHLLENFASASAPPNPTVGQIWFNTDPTVSSLLIFDGSDWKSASGVQKSPIEPGVDQSKVGELWVDTVNQQLYVFSGSDWILVGPEFSKGLKTGLRIEIIVDSNNIERVVSIVYVEDRPIVIFSKDSFTPKSIIPQFPVIRAGVNIASPDSAISSETAIYQGGFLPKLYGTATSADGLKVGSLIVESGKFLRTDIANVVESSFNIKNDAGLTLGVDGTFIVSTSTTAAKIYNSQPGSSIDLQLNSSGLVNTVLRVINGKVGINNLSPVESLDIVGNALINGKLIIDDTSVSTNLNNGAVRIAGGVSISKNLLVNDGITSNATSFLTDILPQITDTYELGSSNRRWNSIRTKTLIADTIQGVLNGSISGNAGTATSLQQQTTFSMSGDVTSSSFQFNGITGGTTKTFNTSISPEFITSKPRVETLIAPQKNFSLNTDVVLIYRDTRSGLLQVSRDNFVGDLAVPIGAIMPFAGSNVPTGFLLCDGTEVLIEKYNLLYSVIGTTYNGSSPLQGASGSTFRIPDLRGRFPLGKDNMDNGEQIQSAAGTVIDGGGGNADRVPGVEPDTLGGAGGNSQYTLSVSSLPNHEHSMQGSTGQQYYASRVDTAVPLDSGAFLSSGGVTANRVQYLPSSGGIKTGGVVGQPYPVVNPFLTINYIIRTGTPSF